MEYNSFYGGRRGASFIISKSFKTIFEPATNNAGFNKIIREDLGLAADAQISTSQRNAWLADNCMTYCFKQGGAYTTVNYDEYVIIDTYNKNDIDNGKIYRRGYDYTNEMGGANYIGQIVGPAGMAPHTELKSYNTVLKMTTEDGLTIPNNGATVTDGDLNQYRKTEAELAISGEKELVPGYTIDTDGVELFNDTIQYVACSIRDFDSHESTVHIGFKIPYLVNVYTSNSVSPYYHRSDLEPKDIKDQTEKWIAWDAVSEQLNGDGTANFNNKELIERTDDESHPFFQKWNISIPKGIKGESFQNFRVTTVPEEAIKDIVLQSYDGKADDAQISGTAKRQILVYDYYNYDRDPSGDPVAIYLGDYNMIENINFSKEGTITINYTHDDTDVYTNLIKWIENVQLNPETGDFVIDFNYGGQNTQLKESLTWVKNIDLSENGTITIDYTNKDNAVYSNYIKWIDNITLDKETGHFKITYNTLDDNGQPTVYETDLSWVKDIDVAQDGTVTINYSNGNPTTFSQLIKWIDDLSLADNGALTVNFNDNTATTFDNKIKWITKTEMSEDGQIAVTYNDGTVEKLNNKVKWITKTTLATDGTLTLEYNDTTTTKFEKAIKWIDKITLTETGVFTVDYNNGDASYTTNIIVPTNISVNTGATEGEGSQKITVTYNNGEVQEVGQPLNYIMKSVIAIPPSDGEIAAGFLYDANYAYHLLVLYSDPVKRAAGPSVSYDNRKDWVDLGYIGQGNTGTVISKESDTTGAALANALPPYSAWFIIEEE